MMTTRLKARAQQPQQLANNLTAGTNALTIARIPRTARIRKLQKAYVIQDF